MSNTVETAVPSLAKREKCFRPLARQFRVVVSFELGGFAGQIPRKNTTTCFDRRSTLMLGIGEAAALGAAALWAVASIYWSKVHLSALGMNLAKNLIGTLLLLLHLAVLACLGLGPEWKWVPASFSWLALSGFVGIVVGDTFFFRSLQILGPRRALMMATTSPIFGVVLGLLFLNEPLTVVVGLGIALTLGGVAVVVGDRKAKHESPGLLPGTLREGVVYGLIAALCQAGGGAFSKLGMVDYSGLQASLIRIAVSLVCTVLLAMLQQRLREILRRTWDWNIAKHLIPAASLGTWLGIWFSQIAFQIAPLASVLTLLATSPLFAIPIVHYYFGQRTTLLSWIGSIIAIVGVCVVVANSGPKPIQ